MNLSVALTHFTLMIHFYTSWKCKKTRCFLAFSGGTKMEHWLEMGQELWSWLFSETLTLQLMANWKIYSEKHCKIFKRIWSLILVKLMGVGLQLHRKRETLILVFFVNFAKFVRAALFQYVSGWLLQKIVSFLQKSSVGRTPAKLVFQKTEGFKKRGH